MKSLQNKESNNQDLSRTNKSLVIVLTVLLIFSLAGNILLAIFLSNTASTTGSTAMSSTVDPQDYDSDQTATKEMQLMQSDSFTWLGRVVPAENTIDSTSKYELVRIDSDGNEVVIESFSYAGFVEAQLNQTSYDKLTFRYSASPGEALTHNTVIVFDQDGEEQMRSIYQSNSGEVVFKKPDSSNYTMKLRTSEECSSKDAIFPEEGGIIFPKTELLGIVIESDDGSENFDLPNPEIISCGVGYGDSVLEPYVSDVRTYPNYITFTLPSGNNANVTLEEQDSGYGLKVLFAY